MPSAPTSESEFNLLCLIVRPQPPRDRIREHLRAGVDFPELLRLAAQHAVRPQLMNCLGRLSWEGVPAETRRALEDFRHRHLLRALTLTEALCRVGDELGKGGVPFATFKGVALAHSLYGDASAREYGDIDIIVPAERMEEAERILADLGYRSRQGDRTFRSAFLAYQRQYALSRGDDGFSIDLHWAFSGAYLPFPLSPEELWRDLVDVTIGGRRILTVGGANLARLLAGHGTKERWDSLHWVNDFALMIDRHPDLDWSGIHRRARAQGCGNAVLLGCIMARDLLGVPVPKDLAELVAAGRGIGLRAVGMIDRMRRGTLPDAAANFTDLDLCDRQRDRIKAALSLVFTRTAGDYAAMPLPPALWGVYHATRPIRLAAKAVAGLF